MMKNPNFEFDKTNLILEVENCIRLNPGEKSLNSLLKILKKMTFDNLNGGLSYFIVDSFSGTCKIGEKAILFEKKYMNQNQE